MDCRGRDRLGVLVGFFSWVDYRESKMSEAEREGRPLGWRLVKTTKLVKDRTRSRQCGEAVYKPETFGRWERVPGEPETPHPGPVPREERWNDN